MRQLLGGFVLFAAVALLLGSAGCGDDDDGGYHCREQCGSKKPYCAPDGSCAECIYNNDCGGGQHCDKDYECKSN